jgi:hypothetical protein
MKLLADKKGQVRVIEAFFAAMLMLSCLTLIPTQENPRNIIVNQAWKAENVLLALDCDGHLAKLIDNHDWEKLEMCVESALPLTTWFNLTVFDKNQNVLNEFPISNGGAINGNIVSFSYVCVDQESAFTIYVLQLQLTVLD